MSWLVISIVPLNIFLNFSSSYALLDLLGQLPTMVKCIFPTFQTSPPPAEHRWRKIHNYVKSPTALYPSSLSVGDLGYYFNEKNRSNQKFHKLSLQLCISIIYAHTFFYPVSVNELCEVLSKLNTPICIPYPIPSQLLNVVSPAILPSLFCFINCFPPFGIIPISISVSCYFTQHTRKHF